MSNTSRRYKLLTDQEKADIQRKIASDPDAPEATDEQLAQAKPFAAAFPDLMGTEIDPALGTDIRR